MRTWLKTTLTLLMIGAIVMAGTAFAAKGGTKPNPKSSEVSITLDQADPHLYDWVTFTLRYPTNGSDRVANPLILVECRQAGEVVWQSQGPEGATFKLGGAWSSSYWSLSDGPASCLATLWSIEDQGASARQIAQTSFEAQGSR
jgi:hypothetical protein